MAMIKRTFISVTRSSPGLRKILWKQLYQLIGRFYRNAEWTFMNYGFASLGGGDAGLDLIPQDEPDRSFIQLYHHVIAGETLRGKEVAEIGCGRGGGCSYMARYLKPLSVCGIDLSENTVRYCRARHTIPSLSFEVGDSERLSLPNESVDVAVNVESSHCYPSMERFLAEIRRILRPGGTFHIADLRDNDRIEEFHACIGASGMRIERRVDITKNVIEAVRKDGGRRVALFYRTLPRPVARYFKEFAGSEGTSIYEKLVHGKVLYFSYLLRKV